MIFGSANRIIYVCDYCLEEITDRENDAIRCEAKDPTVTKINVSFIHASCFPKIRNDKYKPSITSLIEIQDYVLNLVNYNITHRFKMKVKVVEMKSGGWKFIL